MSVTVVTATTKDLLKAHSDNCQSQTDGQASEEHVASAAPLRAEARVVPPRLISETAICYKKHEM